MNGEKNNHGILCTSKRYTRSKLIAKQVLVIIHLEIHVETSSLFKTHSETMHTSANDVRQLGLGYIVTDLTSISITVKLWQDDRTEPTDYS